MKKKYSVLLGGLLASVALTGVCAETDINAILEKDALCDPTSTSWLYTTPPSEVTIKALTKAKWFNGKPKNEGGQKVYKVSSGKTWLGFGLKNVIVPTPQESISVFGTLVILDSKAEKVTAEIEKALQEIRRKSSAMGAFQSEEGTFQPIIDPAPGQVAFSRMARYRSGSYYNIVVNEIQASQGPETVVYCMLTNAQ